LTIRSCAAALMLFGLAGFAAEQGWYPHEGGLLKYSVNIKFGEEPVDTLPKAGGWAGSRRSRVDVRGATSMSRSEARRPTLIIVFDPSGKYLRSWGKGLFEAAHGLRVDKDDNVFVTDITTQQRSSSSPGKARSVGLRYERSRRDRREDFQSTDRCRLRAERRFLRARTATGQLPRAAIFTAGANSSCSGASRARVRVSFRCRTRFRSIQRAWSNVSDRGENNRIQILRRERKFLKQWNHLAHAGHGHQARRRYVDPDAIATTSENLDPTNTLPDASCNIDIRTGKILGAIESPGQLAGGCPERHFLSAA